MSKYGKYLLYFKYNVTTDKYMSVSLRGKIIAPDRMCQSLLPKKNILVPSFRIVRDTERVTFVQIQEFFSEWKTNKDDIDITGYIKAEEGCKYFSILTEDGIILLHQINNKNKTINIRIIIEDTNGKNKDIDKLDIRYQKDVFNFFNNLYELCNKEGKPISLSLDADKYGFITRGYNKQNKELSESLVNTLTMYRHYLNPKDLRHNNNPKVQLKLYNNEE